MTSLAPGRGEGGMSMSMLFEHKSCNTDLENVSALLELQAELHTARHSVACMRSQVAKLEIAVQESKLTENVLRGRVRTRARAAAAIHRTMLEDLLALRSQVRFFEQQQLNHHTTHHAHHSPLVVVGGGSSADAGSPVVSSPPLGQPNEFVSYMQLGKILDDDAATGGLIDDAKLLPDDIVVTQRMLFEEETRKVRQRLDEQRARIRLVCDDRVAATEAKMRRMRQQFHEACKIQRECESRISAAQEEAERRVAMEIEAAAQATTEYIQKFKDEAEATIDHLSVKVADVSMLLETAQAENEVLAGRLERMQHTKKAIAAKQVEELERNLDVLYHQLLGKEEEVSAAKRQLREAQAAMEVTSQRAELLQEELRRRTNLMDDLEDRMHTLKVERDGAAAAAKEEIERMRTGIEAEVQRRVAETAPPFDPEALEHAEEQIKMLRTHCREQDEDIRSLKDRLAEAQAAKKQQTVANLAAMEALERELEEERARLSDTRSQVEALERALLASNRGHSAGPPSAASVAKDVSASSSTSFPHQATPDSSAAGSGDSKVGTTVMDYLRGVYEVLEPCVAGGEFRVVLHGLDGFEAALDALSISTAQDKGRRVLEDAVQSLFRVEHRIRTTSRLLSSALQLHHNSSTGKPGAGGGGSPGGLGGLSAAVLMSNSALQDDAVSPSPVPKLPPCSSTAVKDFTTAAARINGEAAKKQTAAWCKAKPSRQATVADVFPAIAAVRPLESPVTSASPSFTGNAHANDSIGGSPSTKLGAKRSPAVVAAPPSSKQPQPAATVKHPVVATSSAVGSSPSDSPQPGVGIPVSVSSSSSPTPSLAPLLPLEDDSAHLCTDDVVSAQPQYFPQRIAAAAATRSAASSSSSSRRDSCIQTDEFREPVCPSALDEKPYPQEWRKPSSASDFRLHGSVSPIAPPDLADAEMFGAQHGTRAGLYGEEGDDECSQWPDSAAESVATRRSSKQSPGREEQRRQPPVMTVEKCFQALGKGDVRRVETLVHLMNLMTAKERASFLAQSISAGLLPLPVANAKDLRPSSRPSTAGSAGHHQGTSAGVVSPVKATDAASASTLDAGTEPRSRAITSSTDVMPGADAIGTLLHCVQPAVTAFCQTLTEHVVMGRNVGPWCRRVLSAITSVMNASPFAEGEIGRDDDLLLRALRVARDSDSGGEAAVGQVGMKWLSVVEWALRSSLRVVAETQYDLQWQLDANVRSRAATTGREANGAAESSLLRPRSAMTTKGVVARATTALDDGASPILVRRGPRPTPARAQRPSTSQLRPGMGSAAANAVPILNHDSSPATWSSAADRIAVYHAKLQEGARPSSATGNGSLLPPPDVKQRYRHGRADVTPSGHFLPRQFNTAIDVTVRHTLDTVEANAGAVVAREAPALLFATDAGGSKGGSQHAILGIRLQQPSPLNKDATDAHGTLLDAHVAVSAADRPASPEEAEWNPENHLFTDFILQRQGEKQKEVLRETIRCGSAPLHRSGTAGTRGNTTTSTEVRPPQPESRVVYRGDAAASDRQSPAMGPMRPGKVLVHNKDGRSAVRKVSATAPGHSGRGSDDGPTGPGPRAGPSVHGTTKPATATVQTPPSSGPAVRTDDDRSGVMDESENASQPLRFPQKLKGAVARGASSSAALSTVRVPKSTTQRRTAPPASVFQWQRLTTSSAGASSSGGGERRASESESWLTGIGQGLSHAEWPAAGLDGLGSVDDTGGDERMVAFATVGAPPSFSLM